MTVKFRTGVQPSYHPQPFTEGSLPDADKERLCRDLLNEFGAQNVRKMNSELIHSCVLPFNGHQNGDRNPSARLNFRKLTYICSGCGNSGGLLWFIGVCRGQTTPQARSWLTKQVKTGGLGEGEDGLAALLRYFDEIWGENTSGPPPLPRMDPKLLKPWMAIHPYLTEIRGIPESNLMDFRVGFDPVRNRIVVPHFWKGNLVGWQTRRLLDDGTPKWQSSPDFPKSLTLFHYDRDAEAVVVEAPLSVIAKCHVVDGLEATFGATIPERQIKLLAAHPKVTLWFDNDPAGWRATRAVGEALLPYAPVWVVDSPWAADPADMDDRTVAGLVAKAVPFSAWQEPRSLEKWGSDG
jgi:hypothetical protein